MFHCIVVDKNKKISSLKLSNTENLYKKIGLKTDEGFGKQCEWNVSIEQYPSMSIELYGKKIGKANYENKYEFPPPMDNQMFFGKCILLGFVNNKEYFSLTEELWEKISFQLNNQQESEEILKSKKIIYKKCKKEKEEEDDLQLSSSENEEEEYEEEEEEEEDEEENFYDILLSQNKMEKENSIDNLYTEYEIELIEEKYLSDTSEEIELSDDDSD